MLDTVRATVVRRMLSDRSTWPLPTLRMKRIEGDRVTAFGENNTTAPEEIIIREVGGVERRFGSIEQVIEAGWAVD